MNPTIAAISTAAGGGVGVIRLSGEDALGIARAHFRPLPEDLRPRHAYWGWWHCAQGTRLDEGLLIFFEAPRSYTGEDTVELSLHGGALNLRRCLEVVFTAGARPAEPGEFTRRAFLNGRMDLTRAEAVADLIAAQTDRALEQARSLLQGELYRVAMGAREDILMLRAQLEVTIDFVEEDVPVIDPEKLACDAQAIATELQRLARTYDEGRLWRDGARVVLVGAPNAGKSSLFNRLCGDERAIVTSVAGTTRDVLEERVDFLGVPVTLVDTAGLRETTDEVERIGVARARQHATGADLVLWVRDPHGPPDRHESPEVEAPILEVWSKCDISAPPEPVAAQGGLRVSAVSGEGMETLIEAVVRRLGVSAPAGGLVIARERHKQALLRAGDALEQACDLLRTEQPWELAAVDIQEATDALAELVGITSIEDVLDRLFAGFCIGK